MLNDYTHFHFFKGWPKFLPALWSNHHSYTYTGLFFVGVAEILASISSFCAYQQLFSHPTHSSWFQGFHKTDLYTTSERAAKIRFIEQQTKLPPKDIRVFPIFINLAKIIHLFQEHQNTWSYSPDRPKLAEISARSFKTLNNVTEVDTFEVFWKLAEIEASFSIGSIGNMHVYIHFLTLLAEISASFLV